MPIDTTFTHFPSLTTKRLLLRQIRPQDLEALFAGFSDEEAMKFYGHEPHRSPEDTRAWIQQTQEDYERRVAVRWGITLQGDETIIGTCGFHHFGAGFRRAETGYELHRSHWRQGIMTEAMSAVLTYGFGEMDLHRVEAIIDIENIPSKDLLLKLGFTYEGNLRQRYPFRGSFVDEHYFGLLKHEWRG